MEPVVDLEKPAAVTAVADDVLHVRLARRDGEQQAGRQLVPLLGTRDERQPAARVRERDLLGELIGGDPHRLRQHQVRTTSRAGQDPLRGSRQSCDRFERAWIVSATISSEIEKLARSVKDKMKGPN